MSLIFINYRKGLHSIAVSALAERLAQHFGSDAVFYDVRLTSGSRYPDELRLRLNACDVLVALIHASWVRDLADRRDQRLDWVEYEISNALADGKQVIPVLLDQAEPPTPDQLPSSIAELALRQMLRLRATHFTNDLDNLIWQLERHVAPAFLGESVDVRWR